MSALSENYGKYLLNSFWLRHVLFNQLESLQFTVLILVQSKLYVSCMFQKCKMPKLTHSKTFLNKIISFIFWGRLCCVSSPAAKEKKKKQGRQIMLIKMAKWVLLAQWRFRCFWAENKNLIKKQKVFKRMVQGRFIIEFGVKPGAIFLDRCCSKMVCRADYGLAMSSVNWIPGT